MGAGGNGDNRWEWEENGTENAIPAHLCCEHVRVAAEGLSYQTVMNGYVEFL